MQAGQQAGRGAQGERTTLPRKQPKVIVRESPPGLFEDTRPEAREVLIELLRQATGWKKLRMVCQQNVRMKRCVLGGLRQRHPTAPEEGIRRRLADILLWKDVAENVYGPLTLVTKVPEVENE